MVVSLFEVVSKQLESISEMQVRHWKTKNFERVFYHSAGISDPCAFSIWGLLTSWLCCNFL